MFNFSFSIILLLLWINIPIAHSATVYKCVGEGEGGSTLFSETPCKSQKGQKLYYEDNYQPGQGLSDLEKQQLREIEAREQQIELEKTRAAQQYEEAQKTLVNEHSKQECDTADKAVKEWQKIMSLGYAEEAGNYFLEEMQKRIAARQATCGN